MTICTDRKLLREVVDAKPARLKAVIFAIDAFLADTPACDAEKAVLVKELKRCVHVIGLAANQIAPEYRGKGNVYDEAVGSAVTVLADLSPAAAALLAQGEALEMLWDYMGRSFNDEDKRFSVADFEDKWGAVEEAEQEWERKIPAALAPGEPDA
jgi:hypothetical protein